MLPGSESAPSLTWLSNLTTLPKGPCCTAWQLPKWNHASTAEDLEARVKLHRHSLSLWSLPLLNWFYHDPPNNKCPFAAKQSSKSWGSTFLCTPSEATVQLVKGQEILKQIKSLAGRYSPLNFSLPSIKCSAGAPEALNLWGQVNVLSFKGKSG